MACGIGKRNIGAKVEPTLELTLLGGVARAEFGDKVGSRRRGSPAYVLRGLQGPLQDVECCRVL